MKNLLKNSLLFIGAIIILVLAVWAPEQLALYRDQSTLNQVKEEYMENGAEGYRYTLSNNEKLFILSNCLQNQMLPESEQNYQNRIGTEGVNYKELTGSYAFVVNRKGPTEKEIKKEEIYDVCNREIDYLKQLGILPQGVRRVTEESYEVELYSAIDILDPRNNMAVWKVSLSTSQQNADKSNRLLDAYVDADTGKLYEFYVRIDATWEELDADQIVDDWGKYLELEGKEAYEWDNPLLETTPDFLKYRFPGKEDESTIVTIGFYEGINELFIKISE